MKLYVVDSFSEHVMLDLQYLRAWSVAPYTNGNNPNEYQFKFYLDSICARLRLSKEEAQSIKDQLTRREPQIWVECRYIHIEPLIIVNT